VSECSLFSGQASHLRREKEGAQPQLQNLGGHNRKEVGNLVRYNNKVRINFLFETVEREKKIGKLFDDEVRAASYFGG
jgi:hypothetical protein